MKHVKNNIACSDPECWCKVFSKGDMVNRPNHYIISINDVEIEVLDLIKATLTPEEFKGYLIGNITKYLLRHKKKNNEEDLKKMCYYSRELDNVC